MTNDEMLEIVGEMKGLIDALFKLRADILTLSVKSEAFHKKFESLTLLQKHKDQQ